VDSDDTDAAADTATATAASDNTAFNDQIVAGNGQDTIYAFSGDDTIVAATYGGGDDLFYGGDGNDTVDYSGSSADLQIALYDDTEESGIATGVGIDTDHLFEIENAIGGSGNDVIIGSDVANTLIGGDGDDILSGKGGADILDGGAGTDRANYDGLLSDYSFSRNADGSVIVTSELYGVDVLKNIEVVWFSGDDSYHNLVDLAPELPMAGTILGTSGDDHLYGTSGDDTFDSLGGNDYVNGTDGSDTYLYSVNDGDEYIDDESGSMTDVDVLKMKDVNYADVTFSHDSSSSNLVVTVNSTNHVLTLDEQYYSASEGWGLEKVQFADGITVGLQHSDDVWSYQGSSGDDHIVGAIWGKQDIFEGGHGNDVLSGEAGSDTYVYAKGDGSDLIYDNVGFTVEQGNTDVLRLTDLNQSDLTLSRNGDDLKISVNDTGETITVDRQFYSIEQEWGVEQIAFADGTVWDLATIRQSTLLAEATSGNDTIVGFQTADTIHGAAGNDNLYGMEGDDILSGDLGDDYLEGGIGNDTYKFNFGDGHDTIYDNGTASSDIDVLAFGAGISASDVTVTQASNGSDLLLSVGGGGDTVLLKNQLTNNAGGVDQITFADNTNWDRTAITNHIAA
jgi:Ca2+-binding RTX toxin-like protein